MLTFEKCPHSVGLKRIPVPIMPYSPVRTHVHTHTHAHTALLVKMETQAEIRGSESGMGPSGITSRLSCSSEMFEEVK